MTDWLIGRATDTQRLTDKQRERQCRKKDKTRKEGRNIGSKVKERKDATEKEIKKEGMKKRESETKKDGTKIVRRKGNLKRRSSKGCWNMEEKGRRNNGWVWSWSWSWSWSSDDCSMSAVNVTLWRPVVASSRFLENVVTAYQTTRRHVLEEINRDRMCGRSHRSLYYFTLQETSLPPGTWRISGNL